jgi:hypothetical protein
MGILHHEGREGHEELPGASGQGEKVSGDGPELFLCLHWGAHGMLLAADPDIVSSVSFVVTTPGEFRTNRLTRMPLRGIGHLTVRNRHGIPIESGPNTG